MYRMKHTHGVREAVRERTKWNFLECFVYIYGTVQVLLVQKAKTEVPSTLSLAAKELGTACFFWSPLGIIERVAFFLEIVVTTSRDRRFQI